MNRRVHVCLYFALAVILIAGAPLAAQKITGDIVGTVKDATGAVLPGATVTAENPSTGFSRSVTTTASGDYRIVELPPATYKVTATATGFKTGVADAVVSIGTSTTVNFTMEVGAVTETVTVEAVAPLVVTDENRLSTVVDTRRVEDLPLAARDFNSLLQIVPGVQRAPGGGFLSLNINGARRTSNNYAIDGIPNNDRYYGESAMNQVAIAGTAATLVPLEAIEEFQVQSNPGAEFGVRGGSVINVGLKGGTNDFHGSLYGFYHRDWFDARNFFDTGGDPTVINLRQYGGNVGGPIVKNKTFFYASAYRWLLTDFFPFSADVPTPGEIAAAEACVMFGGVGCLTAAGGPGDDMTFGTGDDGTLNTAGVNLLSFYPVSPAGNLTFNSPNTLNVYGFSVKVDHDFSKAHRVSGLWLFGDSFQDQPAFAGVLNPPPPNDPGLFNSVSPTRSQLVGFKWIWTISPTKILDSRVSMTRFSQIIDVGNKIDPISLGVNTGPLSPEDFGVPGIYYMGYFGYIGGVVGYPITTQPNQTYDWQEHYSWVRGNHKISFGGQFQYAYTNSLRNRARTELDVSFSSDHELALEQLLLGYYDGISRFFGDSRRLIFQESVAFYMQDTWKVWPNFTLQYGLRYDISGALGEERDRCSNFLPNDPLAGPDGFVNCSQRPLYDKDTNNFGPRLGFAWDPWGKGKAVLRGGFTVNYDIPNFGAIHAPRTAFLGGSRAGAYTQIPQGNFSSSFFSESPAFNQALWGNPDCGPADDDPLTPPTFVCVGINPITGLPQSIFGPNPQPDSFNVFSIPPDFKTPIIYSYNLTWEYALGSRAAWAISYVGSHGSELLNYRDQNARCIIAFRGPDCSRFRPYQFNFPDVQHVVELTNDSYSWYDSLQTSLNLRNWQGLTGSVNYTWGHSLDTVSINRASRSNFPQMNNPYNIDDNYGHSDHDVRHNFNVSMKYEIPAIPNIHPLVGDGWEIGNYFQYLSGRPFTPIITFADPSGQGTNVIRATCLGVDPQYDYSNVGEGDDIPDFITNVSDVFVFQPFLLTFGQVGSCARNFLRGPGLQQWDFGVFKSFRWSENRYKLQFRWEVSNLLNHPNFTVRTGSIFSSSFARLRDTPDVFNLNAVLGQGGPRAMQLGLKFTF